jgi:hypothetical protein
MIRGRLDALFPVLVKPDCRIVMQKWLLAALQDKEPKP